MNAEAFDVWEKLTIWVILKAKPHPTAHYISDSKNMDLRAVKRRIEKLYRLGFIDYFWDKKRKRYFLTDKGFILAEKLGFIKK